MSSQHPPSPPSDSSKQDASLDSYAKLILKTDSFVQNVQNRRGSRVITCGQGCEACCHVRLELNAVEAHVARLAIDALDGDSKQRLAERAGQLAEQDEQDDPAEPRCVMLEQDGSCAIYEARPLVCRTQGMALRYPPRTFPEEAVMAHDELNSDIVWCPLNYRIAPPHSEDVLEAGRLDEMLALVNRLFVHEDREAMLARHSLLSVVLSATAD